MTVFTLADEVWLPRPIEEVFAFFTAPANLAALTPARLRFRLLAARPSPLAAGTLLDYQIRIGGIPLCWQSAITAWEPPRRFVDEQRCGPYRRFVHEHSFAPRDGGTVAADALVYEVPGGPLDRVVNQLLVKPELARIFTYRRRALARLLGAGGEPPGAPRLGRHEAPSGEGR